MHKDNTDFFDIFDLFNILKKNKFKIIFFTIIYFLLIIFIPSFFQKYNYKNEVNIEIYIEDDLFLPSKYNALSNFLSFKKDNISMSVLMDTLHKKQYKLFFLERHIYGFAPFIDNQQLSSEYKEFYNDTYIKSISYDQRIMYLISNHNEEKLLGNNNEFLEKTIQNLNYRMHISLYDLMFRINEDIKKLAQILEEKSSNNANVTLFNKNILNKIYEQNLITINDFKNSNVENYYLLKNAYKEKYQFVFTRYYFISFFIYLFLISFSSILLLGYNYKKINLN